MARHLLKHLFLILCFLLPMTANGQGIPLLQNFSANEYKAHNQNFDIITDENGIVYVANFEGLLYYDNAQWRIIHTPGVTRITSLYRDTKGVIWTGGYNYIGYVKNDERGTISLRSIDTQKAFQGEVEWMWEKDGKLFFKASDDKVYSVINGVVQWGAGAQMPNEGNTMLVEDGHVTQAHELEGGMKALATEGRGIIIQDRTGKELFRITTDDGLCSNNVRRITYNGHGIIWGATDNGIFAIGYPSIYTHFTAREGLHSEVLSLAKLGDQLYAGTLSGLYVKQGLRFHQVAGMNYACWQLTLQNGALLAATSNGVYRVAMTGTVTQLTTANTLSLMVDAHGFYSGEMDGIFYNTTNGRKRVSDIEKVVKIMKDKTGTIWMQNLYGKLWREFEPFSRDKDKEAIGTLVEYGEKVLPITTNTTKPFAYPTFSYYDKEGVLWLTDNKGHKLHAHNNQKMSEVVYPTMDYSVRSMLRDGNLLWLGGDKGINVVDYTKRDAAEAVERPRLLLRSVVLQGDSVLWGGFGEPITELPSLPSDDHQLAFNFSIDYPSLMLNTQYRTRINGGRWSAWDNETQEEYGNLPSGSHLFEVQARDAYGQVSNTVSISFFIAPPVYLRWYMLLLYIALTMAAIYAFMRWRTSRLEREKERLESLVKERTDEVVKLEKVATVGKLTQGLIDRILNPLNYINNFSKLSEGLVNDVKANVEDEKEHMDEENYEDTMDVLDMLKGNLQKVSEHGANTTRTLKAMEEMLKDRSGGIVRMDLTPLLHQNEEMVRKYFEKDISNYNIRCSFNLPTADIFINGNADQLSKTMMSILGNAVYAVVKKAQRQQGEGYTPEITLSADTNGSKVILHIRDNGVGIEQTIINKIFDPFFTTKTTGEAAGIGLYLCHEIIQNYGGTISVKSEKDIYTEFTIMLPTIA